MNIKNYSTKLALASITLISAVSFAPSAIAEDIIFTGEVTPSCVFSNTTNGTLVENATGTGLTSQGGTAGQTTLTCNKAGGTLTVDAINPAVANPVATTNTPNVTVTGLSDTISAINGSLNTLPLGANTITANMTAVTTDNSVIPAGDYSYTLVLTANVN